MHGFSWAGRDDADRCVRIASHVNWRGHPKGNIPRLAVPERRCDNVDPACRLVALSVQYLVGIAAGGRFLSQLAGSGVCAASVSSEARTELPKMVLIDHGMSCSHMRASLLEAAQTSIMRRCITSDFHGRGIGPTDGHHLRAFFAR